MLERLLRLMSSGGAHTLGQLARQLGVSEMLLDTMLDDLERMGYLRCVPGSYADCGTCPQSGGCSLGRPNRAWLLTEAGQRLAGQDRS